MSSLRPQAHLQRSILISLMAAPARSVVEISERVRSSRPSVSRSLKRLTSAHLVAKMSTGWELTASGRDEAENFDRGLAPSVVRAIERHSRLEHQLVAQMDLRPRAVPNLAAGLTGTSAMRDAIETSFSILGTPANLAVGLTGTSAMRDAIETSFSTLGTLPNLTAGLKGLSAIQAAFGQRFSTLGTLPKLAAGITGISTMQNAMEQRLSALGTLPNLTGISVMGGAGLSVLDKASRDALSGVQLQMDALASTQPAWTSVLAENLALSGRIAADVSILRDALELVALPARSVRLLESAVGGVVSAHHDQLVASIEQLDATRVRTDALSGIVWPTATTARLTSVARAVVAPTTDPRDPLDAIESLVGDVATRLEQAGAPAAARDFRAAGAQIRSRPQGWAKSGPHLVREALREALDELAPRSLVPSDDKGVVTRRAQVTWLCAGDRTLAVWIDVTATNVGKLHELLSAEAKSSGGSRMGWQGHIGLLEAAVGVLRTIVDRAAQRRLRDRT